MYILRIALLIFAISTAPLWVAGEEGSSSQSKILLQDDFVLEGVVTEHLGQIVIRSGRSEIKLPRSQVLCWADSVDGLYQYWIDRRKVTSFEEHLALAQWCLRNDYPAGATRQLIAARKIRPQDPAIGLLDTQLRRYVPKAATAPQKATTSLPIENNSSLPEDAPSDSALKSEPVVETEEADSVLAKPALSAKAFGAYTTIVQPLLLNRCATAGCHGDSGTEHFRLESDGFGRRLTTSQTRQNVDRVLRYVLRKDIENSPIFVFATKSHGGLDEPPLGLRDKAAIESLRTWLRELSEDQVSLIAEASPGSASAWGGGAAHVGDSGKQKSRDSASAPARLPAVEDPFDPELFNRIYRSTDVFGGTSVTRIPFDQ